MSAVSKILRRAEGGGRTYMTFWCPGCDMAHQVVVAGPGAWGWNGNVHRPTFTPSILVHLSVRGAGDDGRCHSFVTDGVIRFLDDCSHQLRGDHPIPDWPHPDWGGSEPAPEVTT